LFLLVFVKIDSRIMTRNSASTIIKPIGAASYPPAPGTTDSQWPVLKWRAAYFGQYTWPRRPTLVGGTIQIALA
jgi:hypothetical protein